MILQKRLAPYTSALHWTNIGSPQQQKDTSLRWQIEDKWELYVAETI